MLQFIADSVFNDPVVQPLGASSSSLLSPSDTAPVVGASNFAF